MPKCLNPTCFKQVVGALYCDDHKYEPGLTTNVRREQPEPDWGGSGWGGDPPATGGGGWGDASDPSPGDGSEGAEG